MPSCPLQLAPKLCSSLDPRPHHSSSTGNQKGMALAQLTSWLASEMVCSSNYSPKHLNIQYIHSHATQH